MHPPCFFKIHFQVILAMPDSFVRFHPLSFSTTAMYAIISHHMCQFPTHLMPQTLHNIMVNVLLPAWAHMQILWGYETKFASVYSWVALHLYSLELTVTQLKKMLQSASQKCLKAMQKKLLSSFIAACNQCLKNICKMWVWRAVEISLVKTEELQIEL